MREETSLISMHPFVRAFVLNIVRTIGEKKFGGEKFVIHADMVPKVSSNVMMASMGAGVIKPAAKGKEGPVAVRRDMSELAAPIEKPPRRNVHPIRHGRVLPPKQIAAPVIAKQVIAVAKPAIHDNSVAVSDGGYGKIVPLLEDPSVTTIECEGKGKQLMVIRAGQRQRTRIILSGDEIVSILEKIADEAHIPLIEGIFRASLPEFSISAVISKMVGFKFVIKKVTAYNLIG